jgi:hypothetical protein
MFFCQVSPTSQPFFVVADDDYGVMWDLLRNGAKKAIIIPQRSCPNHPGKHKCICLSYEICLEDMLGDGGTKQIVRKVKGVGILILPVSWMIRNGYSKEQWE